MRKLMSKVVALLLVALAAAPAAMAQAQRAASPLSKVARMEGKMLDSEVDQLLQRSDAPGTRVKGTAGAADARAMLRRQNAAQFAPMLAGGSSAFHGVVIYQAGQSGNYPVQMYKFSAQAPATTERVSNWTLTNGATYGAVMGETYYYVNDSRVSGDEIRVASGKVYDPETWELVKEVAIADGDLSFMFTQGAYDPVSDKIYTCGYHADGSPNQFGIFNPETFMCAKVATLTTGISAMSFSLDGTLYAVTTAGVFGTIDKATGEFTAIKKMGLTSKYTTSGAIDYMADKPVFYYATNNDDSADLYAIDCATGEYTYVYQFDNDQQIKGMYFNLPAAEDKAPAEPVIDSVVFVGQSLSGSISFTAPTTLYDGTAAPRGQKLTYEVLANDEEILSGSDIEYGHTYKVIVGVDAPGLYKFSVVVYNSVGRSPKAKVVSKWVGPDAPAAVNNVKAAWAADKMTLTWDAVTTGEHDGAIGNVTYAIYNAADSTLVKDAITETTFTFDLKEPASYTEYQYYVTATSDGMESAGTLSNTVGIGNYVAPFATAINATATPNWTIINANGDDHTWVMNAEDASVRYNSSIPTDDWLITLPIVVKKGYVYNVTVSAASGSSSYTETFEVKAGAAPTAEAMTISVIEPASVNSRDWKDYTGSFTAESDLVYLGIHGISAKDRMRLQVNRLAIDGGVNSAAPAASTELNVVVPYSGENKATLTYTTPTLTVAGDELAGANALTTVEVLVNGKIQYVDNQPKAGAVSSIEIPVPTFGVYEFEVIAYNANGAGMEAKVSAYVGINVPADVTNAKVTEVSDGVVNITWDKVTTDVDGNVMNPALVNYTVVYPYFDANGELAIDIIASNISENAVNGYKAVKEGDQQFLTYMIIANSAAGSSEGVLTDSPAVGTPYALPYSETFENGAPQHILDYEGDAPYLFTANLGINSRNDDNGYVGFIQQFMDLGWWGTSWIGDGYTALISGKVAVTEQNPELSFYYAGVSEDATNPITAMIICDGDTTVVGEVNTNTALEWKRHAIDLKAFAGKTVQIMLKATHSDYYAEVSEGMGLYAFVDDIRLGDPVKVDVVAKAISAPMIVNTESAFNISYTIYNQGTDEAKDVHVSLYANGNLVESCVDTLKIASGQSVSGTFEKAAFSIFEPGEYEFSYVVDCEADQDLTNNTSDLVKVWVNNHQFPTLLISGTSEVNDADSTATVKLQWNVPSVDVTQDQVIESFESASYPAFTTGNFAGWTLLNFNDTPTYGISDGGNSVLQYPNACTPFGWQLFDAVEAGVADNDAFAPYEGSCYMAAFAHESGANDAWMISPNMNGVAQTVTFYAKSATSQYGLEEMQCLVSAAGISLADFEQVDIQGYENGVPTEWTKYSIDLPAGTQYFAIRSISTDKFVLMVDNIDYYYTSPFLNLELKGYDVYRNQVKITKAPVTVEEYTDVVKSEGKYDYTVVAVYNDGNSAPSNVYTVDVEFTGLADALAGVKVAVEGSEIVVSGAEAVTIASVDGKLVYNGESGRVAVAPGVYVVKADATTAKVIVK